MSEAISQEILNSLVATLASGETREKPRRRAKRGGRIAHEARLHDFTRSETLPRNIVQTLEEVWTTFAQSASTSLSNYFESTPRCSLLSVEQTSFDQFTRSVPEPTTAALFEMSPLPGNALLEVNPSVAFHIIDHLLGGQGEIGASARPLTTLENALLEDCIAKLLGHLIAAWEPVTQVKPRLIKLLNSANASQVAKPGDAVVVASFELVVGPLVGMISVCMPALSLKSAQLADAWHGSAISPASARSEGDSTSPQDNLVRSISDVPVNCSIRFGKQLFKLEDLAQLVAGDIICLDHEVTQALELRVDRVPRFKCRPVTAKGKLAFQILEDVRP